MTACNLVKVCWCYRGSCWRWRQQYLPKRRYSPTYCTDSHTRSSLSFSELSPRW